MRDIWQALTGNLAMVGLAVSIWAHGAHRLAGLSHRHAHLVLGGSFGAAAIGSMLLAVQLQPGLYFDLRSGLLAVAGLFGGPIAAVAATVMAMACRLLMGGAGAQEGVFSMAIVASIGVAFHYTARRSGVRETHVAVLSVVVIIVLALLLAFLPATAEARSLSRIGAPLLALNAAAVLLCGSVILIVRRQETERRLLRAALEQAPDFLYVKNRDSRFVLSNRNTAEHNHYSAPEQMVGLTDFALTTRPRAEALYDEEQTIMRSGRPLVDRTEQLDGRIYVTSKVPLRDIDGAVIGLAGVTRDTTDKERMERESRENKAVMNLAIEGMSDGFAVFDSQGCLILCNRRYQNAFPLTAHLRVPGTNIADMLRASLAAGEFLNLPPGDGEQWIATMMTALRNDIEHEIELCDRTWLSLKVRWADDKAIVLATDITASKISEQELLRSARELRSLAETDSLTGIANRRVFDDALGNEIARAARNRSTVSLLMIDVDRFKAFNDSYGHMQGDACLKAVGECLTASAGRSGDLVARYGGEEFVVLLPETDEDGAIAVAEQFAAELRQRDIPHHGSEFSRVTASIGIAVARGRPGRPDPASLLRRADAALYDAKHSGRNRIQTWLRMNEVTQVRDAG